MKQAMVEASFPAAEKVQKYYSWRASNYDAGASFELVASYDCKHAIVWVSAEAAPTETELEQALNTARFEAEATSIGIGETAIAIVLRRNAVATMLAHPRLSRRLARSVAPKLHARTILAWAPTTDTIVFATDEDALALGLAELINTHPHELPGAHLAYRNEISISGPASGSLKLHWQPVSEEAGLPVSATL